MTPQDALDRAYVLLRECGIHRGAYAVDFAGAPCPTNEGIKFCSAGAINRVAGDHPEAHKGAIERLQAFVNLHMPSELGTVSITAWNDYFATDEQVLDTFRQLATPTLTPEKEVALTA